MFCMGVNYSPTSSSPADSVVQLLIGFQFHLKLFLEVYVVIVAYTVPVSHLHCHMVLCKVVHANV